MDDAIDDNADLADAILDQALRSHGLSEEATPSWWNAAQQEDLDKAHSTIRQFYRDWSREGFEREVRPVLNIILDDLKLTTNVNDDVRILLPGAGLGRLLVELCLAGYRTEGNEISYHQLFASNYVLNHVQTAEQFSLYPFVTTFTNKVSRSDQLRCVKVPDIHVGTVILERTRHASLDDAHMPLPGSMSMSAGDFITSYSTAEAEGTFDAVVTVYFIDTAPNLIRYVETVRHCLRPGGIWINVGPLLWHFADRVVKQPDGQTDRDMDTEMDGHAEDARVRRGVAELGSFELTNDEVLGLISNMGFEIIEQKILESRYGSYVEDPSSMLQSQYRSSHWVVRKTKDC